MTIINDIKFLDFDSVKELVPYWKGISDLFKESFDRPLSRELWDWAYVNNPFGSPKVSIALVGDRVVGHYAVIPMNLKNSKDTLCAYLAMTTMVSAEYRRYKLFQILAERVYERIDKLGMPSAVIGFPNDKAVAGCRKRLDWSVSEEYAVVQIKPEQVAEAKVILQSSGGNDAFKMDLSDDVVRNWRLGKPNQEWGINKGLGIKETDFGRDLMYHDDLEYFEELVGDKCINAILPLNSLDGYLISFPYRFGFRSFNCDVEPTFMVEMCMSDVF